MKHRPLHAALLGSAWDPLPLEIRRMHDVDFDGDVLADGRCTVERGSGVLSNLIAVLFGFPRRGDDLPVTVRFEAVDGAERWTRTFGETTFSSRLRAGHGRSAGLLCERFGPLDFAQALVVDGARLRLVPRRWSAFGIPLPLWLGPRSNACESVQDGRFCFFVEISHPLAGLIVRYRGWLVRADAR